MLINLVLGVWRSGKQLLACKKGASSELLSAVGLIAITVGIIALVGPTLHTQISTMVNNALGAAADIFQGTWGGGPISPPTIIPPQ